MLVLVFGRVIVRRRIGWITLVLGLLLTGCSNPPKRNQNRPERGSEPEPPPYTPTEEPVAPSPVKGMLAGQVLDRFDRPIGRVTLHLTEVREGGQEGAPVKVWTNEKGYFTIPGLDPAAAYRLTASVKDGERLLAGTMYVRPPNPKLVLSVSEDYVSPVTPAPVSPPAVNETPPVKPQEKPAEEKKPEPKPAVTIEQPRVRPPAVVPVPPPAPPPVPEVTEGDNGGAETAPARPRRDLQIVVPPLPARQTESRSGDRPTPVAPIAYNGEPLPVPSCVMLTRRQVDNFALLDVEGQAWELKRHRRGRLVLVDFWFTACPPCLKAIEHIKGLHEAYRSRGLEVIGIAYEQRGSEQTVSFERAVMQVKAARGRFNIPYRLLMSGDQGALKPCPVATQLGVFGFPTLKLLDAQGNVVWEATGLDERGLAQLRLEIERRLPLTR